MGMTVNANEPKHEKPRNRSTLECLPSDSHLALLLRPPNHGLLLPAGLTDLVGADPLALHGPRAEALVVGVVAGEVAVLDQAASGVAALEVDDFVLITARECSAPR